MSAPVIRTGKSRFSGLATWAGPRISRGRWQDRTRLMASIEVVNQILNESNRGLFRSLLNSRGIIQEKYRGYVRIYDFNLAKTITGADLLGLAEEFNRQAARDQRIGVRNGEFYAYNEVKPTEVLSEEPEDHPTLIPALFELFMTVEATIDLADMRRHLEARSVLPENIARLEVEVGRLIERKTIKETFDGRYYLATQETELTAKRALVKLYFPPEEIDAGTLEYISPEGLRETRQHGEVERVFTADRSELFVRTPVLQKMYGDGRAKIIYHGREGRERYCLADAVEPLLARGSVIKGLTVEKKEILIAAGSEAGYQKEVAEYYIALIIANLGDRTEEASVKLHAAFAIGRKYRRSVNASEYAYKAMRASRLSKHLPAVLAALMAYVPVGELNKALGNNPHLKDHAAEIYEGLTAYHVVRQIPYQPPRATKGFKKGSTFHQNYMDQIAHLAGLDSQGGNPVAFILYFAKMLEKSRAATAEQYEGGNIEELRIAAIFAERCGQKELADDLRNQYLRLHDRDKFDEVAGKMETRIGMTLKQARIHLGTFAHNIEEEVCRERAASSDHLEVHSRVKTVYASWEKTEVRGGRGKYSIEETKDLLGVRFVVETLDELYAVAGYLSHHHRDHGENVEDNVAKARASGWRSITVPGQDSEGHYVEFQVMTKEMHQEDQRGVAAHWKKRAQEETKGRFDQDPVDLVAAGDDLTDIFKKLWRHLDAHVRVFYFGENKKPKDFESMTDFDISRLPRAAIPADAASERARNLFRPEVYAGVTTAEFSIDPHDNRLRVREFQLRPEDHRLEAGAAVSVKLNGGGYLTRKRLRIIQDSAGSPRTRLLTRFYLDGTGAEQVRAFSREGRRIIGPDLEAAALDRAFLSSPFAEPEEMFAAVALGIIPAGEVRRSLQRLGIHLSAVSQPDNAGIEIQLRAPDRPGLLDVILEAAGESELVSSRFSTDSVGEERFADLRVVLRGSARFAVPIGAIREAIESHARRTRSLNAADTSLVNFRVHFSGAKTESVREVLRELGRSGVNIYELSFGPSAGKADIVGYLDLETGSEQSLRDVAQLVKPLGKVQVREISI